MKTSDQAGELPILRSKVSPGTLDYNRDAMGFGKGDTDTEETPQSSQESGTSNYSTSGDRREKSEKLASTCLSALADFVFIQHHLYRQHYPGTPELELEYDFLFA